MVFYCFSRCNRTVVYIVPFYGIFGERSTNKPINFPMLLSSEKDKFLSLAPVTPSNDLDMQAQDTVGGHAIRATVCKLQHSQFRELIHKVFANSWEEVNSHDCILLDNDRREFDTVHRSSKHWNCYFIKWARIAMVCATLKRSTDSIKWYFQVGGSRKD